MDDETNKLLREIRDLIASREALYEDHLSKVRAEYRDQLAAGELARKKSVRSVLIVLAICAALIAVLSRM